MIEYKISVAPRLPVRLLDAAGTPVTGVAFGSVTCATEKSDGTVAAFTLGGGNWSEITTGAYANAGFYNLILTTSETNTAGFFSYAVSVSGAMVYIGVVKVVANEEADTYGRVGAPAGASIAADVAAVKADTASALTKLGSPAGASLSVDVAAVKTDTGNIYARQGAPAGASQSADVAAVYARQGAPAGASQSADIAAVKSDTGSLVTSLSTLVASIWNYLTSSISTSGSIGKLLKDNIDAAISSRSTFAGGAVSSVSGSVGSVTGSVGSVAGDVTGKVLGGGASAFTGTGAQVVDSSGNAVAPASTALTSATWTNARAAKLDYLDAAVSSIAAAVWAVLTSTLTTAATIGKLLVDNINAAISSRSTFAGGAVSSVTGDVGGNITGDVQGRILGGGSSTMTAAGVRAVDSSGNAVAPASTALSTAQWTNARAALLDNLSNLDAAISSIAAAVWAIATSTLTSAGTIGKWVLDKLDVVLSTRATAATSAAAVWDEATSGHSTAGTFGKLVSTDLDATISSRLATSGYTAPDNTSITGIKTKTDALPSAPSSTSDVTTARDSVLTRLGSPAGASVSADVAAVKAETTEIDAKTDALPADPASTTDVAVVAALVSALPGTAAIAAAVWSYVTRTITSGGITAAEAADAVWNRLTSAITTTSSVGKGLVDLLAALTTTRAAKLDYLDASVAAVLVQAGLARKYQSNKMLWSASSAQLVVYDDDGTTPIRTFLFKDVDGHASVTNPLQRTVVS